MASLLSLAFAPIFAGIFASLGACSSTTSDPPPVDSATPETTGETASEVAPPDAADVADAFEVSPATLTSVTPAALKDELTKKDFLFINVHIPNAGEIPGTDKHIAYTDLAGLTTFIGTDLGKKVVVYCLSDSMSVAAGKDLVGKGYTNVRYLLGGMKAWQAAGYPFTP